MGQTPTIILGSAQVSSAPRSLRQPPLPPLTRVRSTVRPLQAAWDLLEKRSHIYSSRPRFVMGNELLTDGMSGLMAPYGDFWRRWRKALHA